jgi:peptide deformylase
MGHPVLRLKAKPIDSKMIGSAALEKLIQDMTETLHETGGVGLAAPQVHESVQLAIVEFKEDSSRYPDMGNQPLTVFINPVITILDEETKPFWEGCLSVPELRGLVERPRKIRVDYLDRKGEKVSMVAEDFLATVLQHELDHLSGILFIDKLKDTKKLAFLDEYRRYLMEPAKPDLD